MKKQRVINIPSIIPIIIFTIIFLSPMAQASESENNVTRDTTMTSNESAFDSEKIDEVQDIIREKNYSNTTSSSELCLSLNEKLKWFFSLKKPDFIDDPYENRDYYNYRATFGIHIAL